MHAFDVLGEPVRRRILELLADGEMTSGAVSEAVRREFGISQPAVSQHLKVLRDSGFATVRADGTRRLYAVDTGPLRDVDAWLDRFRRFWTPPLLALETELARGRRERRQQASDSDQVSDSDQASDSDQVSDSDAADAGARNTDVREAGPGERRRGHGEASTRSEHD